MKSKYTEAQKRATMKYLSEKTDDIRLRLPKGTKDKWRSYAEKQNMSMTAYVHDAVVRQMEYDDTGENEIDDHVWKNLIEWLESNGMSSDQIADCLKSLPKRG